MSADEQLVHRIRRLSDKKAADELFERYYREIYAYVYRQCGQRELAMDLTQDIFLAVFRGIYSYDEKRAGFRTWLYRVASNKVADYYRSRQHRFSMLDVSLEDLQAEIPDDFDMLENVITRENIAEIMEEVSRYDLQWVRIFQQKCFGGRSFKEIAEELALPENTVKTRFYTMAKRIRERTKKGDRK